MTPSPAHERVVLRRSRAGAVVGCLLLGALLGAALWSTWPEALPTPPDLGALGIGSVARLGAIGAWIVASMAWLRRSRFLVVLDAEGVHDGWHEASWSEIEGVELVRVAGVPMLLLRLRDERRELQVPLDAMGRDPESIREEVARWWRARAPADGRPA